MSQVGEVRARPKDFEITSRTLKRLHSASEELYMTKVNGEAANSTRTADLCNDIKHDLIALKKYNRSVYFDTQSRKDNLNNDYDDLHKLQLDLNNLAYQKTNLCAEISSCRNYRSAIDSFELIEASEEQLASNSKPHELTKLRLNAELAERKRMIERIEELKAQKQKLMKKNEKKKNFFLGLHSHVEKLRDIVNPLQEQLSKKQSVLDENAELAQKLPPALYVIYYQAVVYSSSHPEQLNVTLVGDSDEANDFLAKQSKLNFCRKEDESMDLDENVFTKHPLSVQFEIKPQDAALPAVKIRFHFLFLLKIVTVVEIDTEKHYIKPFLSCLYPNDIGSASPNPSTLSLIPEGKSFDQKIGKPYKFAQQLAGLKVLTKDVPQQMPNVPFELPVETLGPESMMNSFIENLCFRLEASDSLYQQVKRICQRSLTPVLNYSMPEGTKIASCTKISQTQYRDCVSGLVGTENILNSLNYEDQSHAIFLRFTVSHGSRSNAVLVYISSSYPFVPPLFTLPAVPSVSTVPSFVKESADPTALSVAHSSSSFDQNLMEIEKKVNTENGAGGKQKIFLLTIQMYKLLNLFEEYYRTST